MVTLNDSSSCSAWSRVYLKKTAKIINPTWTVKINKNVITPAHSLRKSKNTNAIIKLQPTEPAIAYLVTFKSDIILANFWLKNDKFINFAEASCGSPLPSIASIAIYFLLSPGLDVIIRFFSTTFVKVSPVLGSYISTVSSVAGSYFNSSSVDAGKHSLPSIGFDS